MYANDSQQREYDIRRTGWANHGASGTGTAGTLPMSEEEKASVVKKPIGFAPPEETSASSIS